MKKKFSVLVLLTGYPPEHAGAGKRIHNQYVRLKESEPSIEWRVITKREGNVSEFCAGPTSVFVSPISKNNSLPHVARILVEFIWAAIKCRQGLLNDVDAVHVAGFSYYMLPVVYFAKKRGLPVIREMVTTGDVGKQQSIGASLTRTLNKLSHTFIAISPTIRDAFQELYRSEFKSCVLRPNPVDTKAFSPASIQMRKAAIDQFNTQYCSVNFKHTDVIVGMLGRIRESKGHDLLIEAMVKLPENYKLLIVGPTFKGDLFIQRLRDQVKLSDLMHRVTIVDTLISEPVVFYHALDVFAFSSLNEGLGNVLLEALCCGVPVAGFAGVGGNDWLIKKGVNGYLSRRTPEDFATAIFKASQLKIDQAEIDNLREMFSPAIIDRILLNALSGDL